MCVSGSILDCHRKEANGVTYVAGYFYWTTCTIAPARPQDFSGVLLGYLVPYFRTLLTIKAAAYKYAINSAVTCRSMNTAPVSSDRK